MERLKVYCDQYGRTTVNTLPEWAIKEINGYHFQDVGVELFFSEADIQKCDIYFGDLITKDKVISMPNLRWIHFPSTGINRALIKEIMESDIYVTNTPYAFTDSLVHLVLTFIHNLSQAWYGIDYLRKNNCLTREDFEKYSTYLCTLENQKCLIVGLGRVGKKLKSKLESLGVQVSGIKRSKELDEVGYGIDDGLYTLKELDRVVGNYRYVINLLPLTKETEGVFNERIFREMSGLSYFINVGRGGTVNESDLIAALKRKEIAAAALDVFEIEPLSMKNEILQLDNVLVTPHIGNLNGNHWPATVENFREKIERYISGTLGSYTVDLQKGY